MNYLSTGAEDFVHRCTRDAVQVSLASVDAVIEEAAGQQIGERKCCCFISNVCVCVCVCVFLFFSWGENETNARRCRGRGGVRY